MYNLYDDDDYIIIYIKNKIVVQKREANQYKSDLSRIKVI